MQKNTRITLNGINRGKSIPSLASWKRANYGFNLTREQEREALGRYMRVYNVAFFLN
jgi:hypothetical protein